MAEFESELKATAKGGYSRWYWAFGALAALITFLVYIPGLGNNFVNWDDQLYVYRNYNIRQFDLNFLKWAFRPDVLNTFWHPLTIISYAVDYQILGLNPYQYHLTNIVFHTLNTFLVFFLAKSLYEARRPEESAARALDAPSVAAGLVAALLFGVHPLRVESVVWISERKDVLYAFFFLLSVLAYLKYARPQGSGKALWYALSLAFFILSIMSKPMAVTLPMILLILDWYPLNRFAGGRNGYKRIKTAVLEKLPFFVVSLSSALMTLTVMHGEGNILTGIPLWTRSLVSIRGCIYYIYKMFLPFNLVPLYPYPKDVSLFDYNSIATVAAFLLVALFCALTLRRFKSFTAAWLSYLIMLLPVIGIIQTGRQFVADRYTYMPLLSLFLLVGFGAAKVVEKTKGYTRIIAVVPAVVVFVALSSLTIRQEAVWKDSAALWIQQISVYPAQAKVAYYYRALVNAGKGDFNNALKDFDIYIGGEDFDRTDTSIYVNRGLVYMELKDFDAALKDFDMALAIKPKNSKAMLSRGVLHAKADRCRQAVGDLQNGLKLEPENPYAVYVLGTCYERLGMRKEAAAYLRKAADMGWKVTEDLAAAAQPPIAPLW